MVKQAHRIIGLFLMYRFLVDGRKRLVRYTGMRSNWITQSPFLLSSNPTTHATMWRTHRMFFWN